MVSLPIGALLLAALPTAVPAAPLPQDEPIPVLVVSGANNHDWQWTTPSLARILEASGRFDVTVTYEPAKVFADEEERAKYRAFVLDYNGPGWGDAAEEGFLASVRSGAGVVVIHAADNSGVGWPEYERLVGDLWRRGTGHGRFHAFDVEVTDRDHPVTRTLPTILKHPDELYHRLVNVHGVERRVLATAYSDPETGGTGANEPMILTRSYGEGRVFHTPLGHVWRGNLPSQASHNDPQFRGLVVRGTEWAATGSVRDAATAPAPLTDAERAAGWQSLMDRALWRAARGGEAGEGWAFEGDVVRRTKASGDIVTKEVFEDFELTWQWKASIAGNSGVKYRIPADGGGSVGPEYQMLEQSSDTKNQQHRAGALYDVVPTAGAPEALWGEFRSSRIVARGTRLEHWLDGVKVMEADTATPGWAEAVRNSKFRGIAETFARGEGRILLQDHSDEVWVRGMRIRRLEADAPEDDDSAPLFAPGDDLSGWSRVGDATYRVEDDLLIGNAGPRRRQSFLVSNERYHDFELVVGVRIAVLGNSGIQLRSHLNAGGQLYGYQAEIDPTDRSWSAGIYDEGRRGWLDPLDDNPAAREAFDRGGWNEYRIRCEGPRIRTWVNGVPAADLLDGADLEGSLGFQIHGGDDDIEMRWRDARVRHLGAHAWVPAEDGALLGTSGARVTVTGDDARAVLTSAGDPREVALSAADHWRKGAANVVTLLGVDGRMVLQVNDRTVLEGDANGLEGLSIEGASAVAQWRKCRRVPR